MSEVTLTDFLLARIAEDEAEIGPLDSRRDEGAGPNGLGWAEVGAISEILMVSQARVLAECAAKRRVVELHADPVSHDVFCGFPCETLCSLASVYADHPDYRAEWGAL